MLLDNEIYVFDDFIDIEYQKDIRNILLGEFDLTYTMRSVGTYMRDQKDRKELMLFNYDIR